MNAFKPVEQQLAILMRGVEFGDEKTRVNMEAELRERLAESVRDHRPLRVYCGFDPTKPDLHLGHTVPMRKLAQFQELGHEVIFLIGTFTSLVGDASDKTTARRMQTEQEAQAHAQTYADQAWHVLDRDKTIVKYNGDWLSKLTLTDVIGLASNFTVQQFLVRENFALRYEKGEPIWLHEFLYALMQGYDAVAMKTDIQIGGTEQLFNLLAGRKLMESFDLRPQTILTFPILVGTDGVLRMSKSTGNHIGIAEAPESMFGKVMSIPDSAMRNYADLLTRWSPDEIREMFAALERGELHPRDLKMRLAFEIVDIFKGREGAEAAQAHFRTVFQERDLPSEMPELRLSAPIGLVDLITAQQLAPSKSEARRLVTQGGVKLDGERVEDFNLVLQPGADRVLQVGRRKFLRLLGA